MTQAQPRLVPTSGDAPTLTLAVATLVASVYPKTMTPEQADAFGKEAVTIVFNLWNEVQDRIAAGMTRPVDEGG